MDHQDLFQLAVEEAPILIVITDTEGVIQYANRAAEHLTGYSNEEMVGSTPSLWGQQMDVDYYKEMWDVIKFKRETFRGDLINKKKDGSFYLARSIIKPVITSQAKLIGFIGIEKDVESVEDSELPEGKISKDEMPTLASRLVLAYKDKHGLS
jgi:PAS domain S-box-containing protein